MQRHHVLREAWEAALDAVEEGGVDLTDLTDDSLEDLFRREGLSDFLLAFGAQTVEARAPGLAELFADIFDEWQVVCIWVGVCVFAFL